MTHSRSYILFFLLFITHVSFAQYRFNARIVDEDSREPLAFVNVVFNKSKQAQSDIEGRLSLISPEPISKVMLSYVGYNVMVFQNNDSLNLNSIATIRLKRSTTALTEVVVMAGENPAHRIIKHVTENRKINNPEKLSSFQYVSYNKMYFTVGKDSITANDTGSTFKADTSKAFNDFVKKSYLFLMESVTERKFMAPSRNNEKVVASRVSGFQNPSFTMLATQLQSFSFYNDMISLSDKAYLNPIAPNSISKYTFILEDTLLDGSDSIYIISFLPKKGKNIDGLKGVLYINTNGYAIQNVIASPSEIEGGLSIKIQQKYERVDSAWFPVQLNTDISLGSVSLNGFPVTGVGRSYISEIVIRPPLRKKQFDEIEVEILPDAMSKPATFWDQYRKDSLTQKEVNTFKVIDSIGKASHLEQKLKSLDAFLSGKWPYHFINFDLQKILAYNKHEGFRLGLGLETNEKITKYVTLDGYGAYGLKDKKFKYGGGAHLEVSKLYKTRVSAIFKNDVVEAGAFDLSQNSNILSASNYRSLLVRMMDQVISKEYQFTSRLMRYFTATAFYKEEERIPTYVYTVRFFDSPKFWEYSKFSLKETGFSVKFIYKEKFMKISKTLVSLGSKFPELNFKYTQGVVSNIQRINTDYTRYLARINYSRSIRNLGKSSIVIEAAKINGLVPYGLLITGEASYENWSISSPNSFRTMRMNEFLSNEYAAVFFNHNFAKLLFKTKYFQPGINLCFSYAVGTLRNQPISHLNVPYKTLEKGFYETGLELNNIIKVSFVGIGVGGFYRLGDYAFTNPKDNYAVVLTLGYNL